jgi:hypothetical protein
MRIPKSTPLIINATLAVVLVAVWGSVFVVNGIIGATAWGLAILVLGPAGVVLSLAATAFLIVGIIRRRPVAQRVITLVLSCVLAAPVLILLNIAPMAYPATVEDTHPSLAIVSPFKQDVTVGLGGDSTDTNAPHVIWASERWAYDLVADPHDTGSRRLQDYGIYGMDVYSPVSGIVTATLDGEPDVVPNTDEFTSAAGNYIHIRVEVGDTDVYLLLAHLREGSLKVSVGDSVAVGDHLAQVGNTGTTSEPHLHIHLQRQDPAETIHSIFAEGLPLYFYDGARRTLPSAGALLPGQ